MNVLGLKIRKHDTGAALIADGQVVAIAEERLCRIKHSFDIFPKLSIDYCLEALKVKAEEINLVVIDQVGLREKIPMKEIFLRETQNRFSRASIEVINHHDAHAASAFFCSPFEEAAILVYDGSGEKFKLYLGAAATETETLYRGQGNRFFQLQKTAHLRESKAFPYTFGIGKIYALISNLYLNFGAYNEGKMMGLAPYGNDSILKQFPLEKWFVEKENHLICNARITFPRPPKLEKLGKIKSTGEFIKLARNYFKIKAGAIAGWLFWKLYKFSHFKELFFEPMIFKKVFLPRPPRVQDKLPDDYYSSVAYAIQKVMEEIAVRWALKVKNMTGAQNLCVAGGLGLNIDTNKKFLDEAGYKDIFIQPASSDTGVALGCALYGWHMILGQPRFWVMKNAELGRKYSEEKIKRALEERKSEIIVKKSSAIASETAQLLSQGKIIGWFQGGAEYGPRALGHRSIICNAGVKEMKDILNNRVKHREYWRPFAASVLKEEVRHWFELEKESPFMLLAAAVKKEKQELIPSIVHVDGTCRIQSVDKENNRPYYDLISAFYKITKIPMVLNTSFNLAGEPIVETPQDALSCFLITEMDYLVIENYLVRKK